MVVGVAQGLKRCTQKRPRASSPGISEGTSKIYEFSAKKKAVRGVSGVPETNGEVFVGGRPDERELDLEELGFRVRLRALVDGGSRFVHLQPATNREFGNRTRRVG